MTHHTRSVLLLAAVSVFGIVGCDNETPSSTASGNGAPADPGKAVSKDSQLVGMWYRDGAVDDPIGLEFTADGKVSAVGAPMGRGNAVEMTFKYELLDGGRLRLSVPGSEAMTQVIQANVNGSTLTIRPETGSIVDIGEGTFSKLPAGKTIVARHQERLEEIEKERVALAGKLADFIAQPKLAIVPADGAAGSLHVAFDGSVESGTWNGVALLDVADTTVQRQAQISVNPSNPPTVVCTLGPVTGPPGAKPKQNESFTFTAKMNGNTVELRDNAGRLLKPDASTHEKLSASYAAGIQKQRDAMDAFHAKLGTFIYAEEAPNGNQRVLKVAILREPGKDSYRVAQVQGGISSLTPASFNLPLQLVLQNGEPELQTQQGQMIRIKQLDGDKAGELEVAIDGYIRPMKVTTLLSADAFDAKKKEAETFIAGLKSNPLSVAGTYYQSYTYANGYVRPMRLTLNSPDGKTLGGTFHAMVFDKDLPLTGDIAPTLFGALVKFKPTVDSSFHGQRFDEGGTFTMELKLEDGKPSLVGRVQPGDGANRMDLASPSKETTAAIRKQFDDHLAAGGAFTWARTGNTGGSNEILNLVLQSDAAGKITGTAGFRRAQAAITGEASEVDGFTVIDLNIPATPPHATTTGTLRLWVVPFGDSFYLSGNGKWTGTNASRIVCYGPAVAK